MVLVQRGACWFAACLLISAGPAPSETQATQLTIVNSSKGSVLLVGPGARAQYSAYEIAAGATAAVSEVIASCHDDATLRDQGVLVVPEGPTGNTAALCADSATGLVNIVTNVRGDERAAIQHLRWQDRIRCGTTRNGKLTLYVMDYNPVRCTRS